jgi:hypothetical protein
MQFTFVDDFLDVSGIPNDTTKLLVLLNGVKCYQQEHVPGDDTAVIAMRGGVEDSEMTAVLPVCRGGSLQVYAIDDTKRVLGTASLPNFCHTSTRCGSNSKVGEIGRVVASALRSTEEVHRWEFPIKNHNQLTSMRVSFECPSVETSSTMTFATVRWTVVMGHQWGTTTNTNVINKNCLQSLFTPPIPTELDAVVTCELVYAMNKGAELRYVIHNQLEPFEYSNGIAQPRKLLSTGKKMAVLVGVSKYTRRPQKRMSDLEYADDDVVLWYEYLRKLGYICKVFGDEFSPYPQWDGPATVHNVREAVQNMVKVAQSPADHLVFVTSSHGAGDGRGNSYLCLLPDPFEGNTAMERQGSYMDYELASDLSGGGKNQSRNFVFIDACFSGGLIEELLVAIPNIVGTTTCTRKGYGYDDAETCSGAWTNAFLHGKLAKSLRDNADLVQVFTDAQAKYVTSHPSRGDRPCFFGRCSGYNINTENDEMATLPRGVFTTEVWLPIV